MKKLFVMLMALTVLGVQAGAFPAAKVPQDLHQKTSKTVQKQKEALVVQKDKVLENLKRFRQAVERREVFNGSYIMQDMTALMDSYLALADKSEAAAVVLNEQINQPIKAGWGRTVTIAQLIRDNGHYVMSGTSTADDFDRFEELLGKTLVIEFGNQSYNNVVSRYRELMRYVDFTRTQPYNEQSFDNTVMPFVINLMEAHNKLKAEEPRMASMLGATMAKGNFDIPAFIDKFAYGWPSNESDLEDYAKYLRACKK